MDGLQYGLTLMLTFTSNSSSSASSLAQYGPLGRLSSVCLARADLKKVASAAIWWLLRSTVLCRGARPVCVQPLATLETFTAVWIRSHGLLSVFPKPGDHAPWLSMQPGGSVLVPSSPCISNPVVNVKETRYLFYPKIKRDKFHFEKIVKKLLGRNSNSFKVSTSFLSLNFCLLLCVLPMPREDKEGVGFLRTGVLGSCDSLYGFWNSNLGPLHVQLCS